MKPLEVGGTDTGVLISLAAMLPSLPSALKYYDDFDDIFRVIKNIGTNNVYELYSNGQVLTFYFNKFDIEYSTLLRHIFYYLIANEELEIGTAYYYLSGTAGLTTKSVIDIVAAGPAKIASTWALIFADSASLSVYCLAKSILRVLCHYGLFGWSKDYYHIIYDQLPIPHRDRYAGINSGNAFLSIVEEASIVDYINSNSDLVNLEDNALSNFAALICAFQFGVRPVQISKLRLRDIKILNYPNELHSIHLDFVMAKQLFSNKGAKFLRRKVKTEWSEVFLKLYDLAIINNKKDSDRLFDFSSSKDAGLAISKLIYKITGENHSATTLRHTAAQRLVDAGANQEELAEFMGHSHISTGLIYFETSANQTELINKALGISATYQRVARIAHDQFISNEELAELKGIQQIAGAPHGIPISGIGGCGAGQPACPYNPVLSCYGCRKFMPVHEVQIHEQVLDDLRQTVSFFHTASRNEANSPAYLQLQRTIAGVQSIIDEIEASLLK